MYNDPRGFLYLSAGIAVIGQIGQHVRFLPQKKKGNVEFSAVKAVELLFKKDVAFQDAMCLHVISRAGTC